MSRVRIDQNNLLVSSALREYAIFAKENSESISDTLKNFMDKKGIKLANYNKNWAKGCRNE